MYAYMAYLTVIDSDMLTSAFGLMNFSTMTSITCADTYPLPCPDLVRLVIPFVQFHYLTTHVTSSSFVLSPLNTLLKAR